MDEKKPDPKVVILSNEPVEIIGSIPLGGSIQDDKIMEETTEYLHENYAIEEVPEYTQIEYFDEELEASINTGNKPEPSTSDNREYITTDDDPIAEFLKISVKSFTKRSSKRDSRLFLKKKVVDDREDANSRVEANQGVYNDTLEVKETREDKEKVDIYMKEKNTLEMLPCDRCKQMFSNKHFLKQHMAVHDKYIRDNKYFCRLCDLKRFPMVNKLLAHIGRYHKTSGFYTCSVCDVVFIKQLDFSLHIKNTHEDLDGKFGFDHNTGLIVYKKRHPNLENNANDESDETNAESMDCCQITETENTLIDTTINMSMECDVTVESVDPNETKVKTLDEPEISLHLSCSEDSATDKSKNVTLDETVTVDSVTCESESMLVPIRESPCRSPKPRSSKRIPLVKKSKRHSRREFKTPHVCLDTIFNKDGYIKKSVLEANGVTFKGAYKLKRMALAKSTFSKKLNAKFSKLQFRCHFCSRGFKDCFTFNLHIKTHFEEDTYLCVCGVRLKNKQLLEEHKQKYHNKNDSGNILLMKLNDESYIFVQHGLRFTMQGTLKKVDLAIESPLMSFESKNDEFMGNVCIKPVPNNIKKARPTYNNYDRLGIRKISQEEALSKQPFSLIKSHTVGPPIPDIQKPFKINSSYVDSQSIINSIMYDGITNVTRLSRKSIIGKFPLKVGKCHMPFFDMEKLENIRYQKNNNKVYLKPLINMPSTNLKNLTLVNANPLAHLIPSNVAASKSRLKAKRSSKVWDYESIIKKGLADLLSPGPSKTPKKK